MTLKLQRAAEPPGGLFRKDWSRPPVLIWVGVLQNRISVKFLGDADATAGSG